MTELEYIIGIFNILKGLPILEEDDESSGNIFLDTESFLHLKRIISLKNKDTQEAARLKTKIENYNKLYAEQLEKAIDYFKKEQLYDK